MNKNLNKDYSKVFEDFDKKIASITDKNKIALEINTFSKRMDITGVLNAMLESFVHNKYYGPSNSVNKKITLFNSLKYEFSIMFSQPKGVGFSSPYLYSYAHDVFICPLIDVSDSGYKVYEQSNTLPIDVLNTEAKLILETEGLLLKNKTVYLKKFINILKLDESKPFIMLMVTPKEPGFNFIWEYDSKTLKPTRLVEANIDSARLGTTAKILANIGDSNSIHLLKKLCNHSSHVVRWDSLRSLMRIDYDEGIKVLRRMTKDSHKEVNSAAAQSLKMLNLEIH